VWKGSTEGGGERVPEKLQRAYDFSALFSSPKRLYWEKGKARRQTKKEEGGERFTFERQLANKIESEKGKSERRIREKPMSDAGLELIFVYTKGPFGQRNLSTRGD